MPWLDVLNPYNYEPALYFDPDRLYTLIAQEPLAMLAVTFSFLNLCAMVTLKLSDYWWDHRKQKRQRGHIQLEAFVHHAGSDSRLELTLTNTGGETLVLRAVGLKRPWWTGGSFQSLPVQSVQNAENFPLVLNARAYKQVNLALAETADILKAGYRLAVRDSVGSTWGLSRLTTWLIRGQINRFFKSLHPESESIPLRGELAESLP